MPKKQRLTAAKTLEPDKPGIYRSKIFKYALAVIILIASITLVYWPSFKVPFLLDDYGKIIRNSDIKSLSNIPSRLVYRYNTPSEFNRNDPSRPLTYLTLTLNYHYSELDPFGYHIVNIALHCIVVLLIFILGLLLFPLSEISGFAPSLLAALFFAVHPINANVVSYVMGRATSLATIFYVLSAITFIRAQCGAKWARMASVMCFICALASNQLALTLPAIILLIDFCFFCRGNLRLIRSKYKQHIVYWGLLAVYLAARLVYFTKIGDIEASIAVTDNASYALTQFVVIWKYVQMVIFPSGLSFEHLYVPINSLADIRVLLATVLYMGLTIFLIRRIRSSWINTSFAVFCIFWFLITISPTSSIFPTTATMAENRVYLPLVGLCLIFPFIGCIFVRQVSRKRDWAITLMIGFCLYVAFLGSMARRRNILYQDPIGIWMDVINRYPNHERAHKNLALAYLDRKQFDPAAKECEKALALDPNDFDARNNLAAIYYDLGRFRDAQIAYLEMVKEKPDYAPAYNNLGLAYEQLHKIDDAIRAYQNAIRLNPGLLEPLNNLGNIYAQRGHFREATDLYQAALKVDPHNPLVLENYAKASSHKL